MRRLTPLSLLAALHLAAALVSQKNLVLPDQHYLCENDKQLGSAGTTGAWRVTGGRFLLMYEARYFLDAGITGPVTIHKLRFRSTDGVANLGGQVYGNVAVQLGSTTLNVGTFNTTRFPENLVPSPPETTTLGQTGTTNVTVAPSVGSVPNNWCIEIDLAAIGAAFVFDPTSAEPNLLIHVTMPSAPSNAPPLLLARIQDAGGTLSTLRSRAVSSGAAASTGGTALFPIVAGLEFSGPGGYPNPLPARNEYFGAASGGSPSTFYQSWLNGQAFDLGTGITLIPDRVANPNFYLVRGGANPVDTTQVHAIADVSNNDGLATHAMGFSFAYPGGATSTIKASANGFVWLDPTMTDSEVIPTVDRMLGGSATSPQGARLLPFWYDFHAGRNLGLNPAAGLHVKTDTSGGPGNAVCYVTWLQVAAAPTPGVDGNNAWYGHSVWTMQVAMHQATGVVEYRYAAMPTFVTHVHNVEGSHAAIVGFTRGRIGGAAGVNSVDPQSRDLSAEVPFATAVEGTRGNIGLVARATPRVGGSQYGGRLHSGQSITWNAVQVPPGAQLGAQLIDFAASMPGLQIPGLTAPGCVLSLTANLIVWETFPAPGSTVTGTIPLALPSGYGTSLIGIDLYSQFVVLNLTGGDPIAASSNALRHTFGLD